MVQVVFVQVYSVTGNSIKNDAEIALIKTCQTETKVIITTITQKKTQIKNRQINLNQNGLKVQKGLITNQFEKINKIKRVKKKAIRLDREIGRKGVLVIG